MEHRLSATELARSVGDVLGRVRYRGDSFLIERNGEAVARVVPLPDRPTSSLREILRAWKEAGPSDAGFARDVEQVNAQDRPPTLPWDS